MPPRRKYYLTPNEIQELVNQLTTYRDQLSPTDPNHALISQQLTHNPVVGRTELFAWRLTGNEQDQTLISATGIVAFGKRVGNAPASLEMYFPNHNPGKTIPIDANWVWILHGSMRKDIHWQYATIATTQTPFNKHPTRKTS